MPDATAPRIRRTAQNTQFTYNLSRHIHDVQTYPSPSPQGASILIYGHDSGVTLVWRGGRRFKPMEAATSKAKQNGSAGDSVMVIDSDEEDEAAAPGVDDKPQFEEEGDTTPYPEIVQTLDLTLGTAVLKVAVVPRHPAALGEKMVFAASCVTGDVYLITLPSTPPSPQSKARPELKQDLLAGKAGSGAWGESLILLGGQRKPADGIAVGLILPDSSEQPVKSPRAIVASHSREASGILRLWDADLDPKAKPQRAVEAFQTEFLPQPLTGISFNPTHTTQLLATSSPHGVRVYDFATPSLPPDPEATGPFPAQGSWLLTLYQPFARPSSTRKPIVDAAWIAHGRAVFCLLADGMWGVWDIEGVGSGASSKLKLGVHGAALTVFSVSGYVEGTASLRSVSSQTRETQSGEFVPMTPHTRRQATASMSAVATADRLATTHGGVRVTTLPASGRALPDESLALWIGGHEHVGFIPSVSRFWETQLKKGAANSLFNGNGPAGRMLKIQDLATGLLGERCCGVSLVTDGSKTADDAGYAADVLVQGETRLVVVREGEDGPGKKIGGTVSTTRRRLFSKDNNKSDAIIVRGSQPRAPSASFNLSTVKARSLRLKSGDDGALLPARPRVGFDFTDTLDAAADERANTSRDVDAEMLDIMGIDKALDNMGEKML